MTYFNPHSREGSDHPLPIHRTYRQISIHTPAKGVTKPEAYDRPEDKISIHTPAKGVTDDCAGSSKTRMISIHTPAKGVTEVKCLLLQNWNNFNPHSREGSDMFRRLRRLLDRISIHTPAKGVTK